MSETQAILIMMNNYLHDVATALLAASGFACLMIYRNAADMEDRPQGLYFLAIYRGMSRLALFSLVWIVMGGIPRTIFYKQFEWANAAGKGQVVALVVKHILAFLFVGLGVILWVRLGRRARAIRVGMKQP